MAEAVNSAARPPWAYESMPVKKNFNLLVRRRGGGGKTLSKMQHEASTSCESPDALLTWQHSCGNEGDNPESNPKPLPYEIRPEALPPTLQLPLPRQAKGVDRPILCSHLQVGGGPDGLDLRFRA